MSTRQRRIRVSSAKLIGKREAKMKQLADVGPIVRGSLVTAKRGNHTAHQLTVSVNGKTNTVYVPLDMVKEVKTWTMNYRKMQRLIRDIAKLSMAIIHCKVPESRGGDRGKGNRHRSP